MDSDADESKPLLHRSPASTSPTRDGPSGNDDLSGDRTRRYSPPRSPSPPTPSPLAKGRSTSPSSTSPLAKNPMASDADKPSNGNSTRGAASPRRSPTPSSSADIGKQGHEPQPAPKAEEEAAADSRSKNHKEERDKASPGEEKEKTAEAPAALSEKEKAAAAPAVLSEKGKAAAAPAAPSEKEKAAAAPAALSEKEKAASARKKAEIAGCFPSPFPGGQSVSNGVNHVVDVDGPSVDNSEAEGRDLTALIRRAEELSHYFVGHHILADPSAEVTVALRTFAAAADATTAAARWLEEAAAALDKVSTNPELDVVFASAAKLLALEAAGALAAHRRGQEPGVSGSAAPAAGQAPVSGTSNELLWAAVGGSLGLLPYLHDLVPKDSHLVVAGLFGAVFCAASIGATMTVRDVHYATIVGAFSFTAFSVLVVAFLSFALAQGNIWLTCACTAIPSRGFLDEQEVSPFVLVFIVNGAMEGHHL
ncbi:hypothetical protein VPH35_054399 [Triticum aestivum]|uniref:Uncharacterized protein n=1 Tax=Triticum aestivum TaxID=4565 RepID=A0A077RXZ1_WHEAT|nr:unnamed protein product [Triticum aestivum]